MRLAPRAARQPSENVVPLINVVFLLLIFFMLTSRLSPLQPIEVELPTASSAAHPDGAFQLFVSRAGALVLDGDSVSSDELIVRLRDHSGALEVRADARLPARILLPLLEQLQGAGLDRVDLVTRREP